jgi:hypothetical protein
MTKPKREPRLKPPAKGREGERQPFWLPMVAPRRNQRGTDENPRRKNWW